MHLDQYIFKLLGKIVLKKETKEKKETGTKKQKMASAGVEPGLSACASNSLTTAPPVTHMTWKINFVMSQEFFAVIDAVLRWWSCIYREFKYTFEEN